MNRQQIIDLCTQDNLQESDRIVLINTITELYDLIDEQQDKIHNLEMEVEDLQDELDELDNTNASDDILQQVCKHIVREHIYDINYKQYPTISSIVNKLDTTLFYEYGERV